MSNIRVSEAWVGKDIVYTFSTDLISMYKQSRFTLSSLNEEIKVDNTSSNRKSGAPFNAFAPYQTTALLEELERRYKNGLESLTGYQRDNNKLIEQLSEAEEQIKKLNNLAMVRGNIITSLDKELTNRAEQLNEKNTHIRKLEEEVKTLREILNMDRSNLSATALQYATIHDQYMELSEKYKDLADKYEKAKRGAEAAKDLNNFMSDEPVLRAIIASLKEKIKDVSATIEALNLAKDERDRLLIIYNQQQERNQELEQTVSKLATDKSTVITEKECLESSLQAATELTDALYWALNNRDKITCTCTNCIKDHYLRAKKANETLNSWGYSPHN
jgi:chromosome segregation ATPase